MMKLSMTQRQLGSLCAIGSAFLFSSKAVFIKQAYAISTSVDATLLMALRMASALPFFLIICWLFRENDRDIAARDWALLVLAGLIGYYFASWLDFIGLMYISASLERIILFLYPTLTVLASSVIYKQKLTTKTLFAIALSYGGTLLVLLQEHSGTAQSNNFWLGASLVFASAVAFASYLLLTPRLIQKFGSWNFTGLALSVACIGTLIHYFIVTPQPITLIMQLPRAVIAYGVGLGILVTVLPTILLMQGIKRIGASQAAMIASVGPILTILLAVIFLGEQLNAIQWLGCILNITGILIISLSKNKLKH